MTLVSSIQMGNVKKPVDKDEEKYGQVISARLPTELHDRLRKRHPNKGDTQRLLKALVERYLDGRILGVKI